MTGIYLIRNNVNNKIYIGQSINIETRWSQHKSASKNEKHRKNSHLYKAMKKYGVDAFSLEILEECDPDDLNEREIYYIEKYNSTDQNIGYNISAGRNLNTHLSNENNPNAKMKSDEIWDIRESYGKHEDKLDIYARYEDKISINTFNDIWQGKTWNNIHMDVYTEENKKFHQNNYDKVKSHESIRVITDEQIKYVRDEYNKGILSCKEVFENSGIANFNTFYDIWQNNTFKYIQSELENKRTKIVRPKHWQDGEKNCQSKFTNEEVLYIRKLYEEGIKVPEIYKEFKSRSGINAIYNIVNNKTYKNI